MEEYRGVGIISVEYGLNGQTVRNPFVLGPPITVTSEVTSKWQENKLVSTIDVVAPGESDSRHYIQTMSISPEGILAVRIQRVGSSDSRTLFYQKSQ